MNERLVHFTEMAKRLDLAFLEDQAVWRNYHEVWCRYRGLQVEIIRQIRE
jgi:hypothetical protein